MRVVLQRVSEASVQVDREVVGAIGRGWLVFLGVAPSDTIENARQLVEKIIGLRLFSDSDGKFNLSLGDVKGEALIVSQFTLYADCSKGRRPSFVDAAPPPHAEAIYTSFVQMFRDRGIPTRTGRFGADMNVQLVNQGPVTIVLELEASPGKVTSQ